MTTLYPSPMIAATFYMIADTPQNPKPFDYTVIKWQGDVPTSAVKLGWPGDSWDACIVRAGDPAPLYPATVSTGREPTYIYVDARDIAAVLDDLLRAMFPCPRCAWLRRALERCSTVAGRSFIADNIDSHINVVHSLD